ncbi:mediator of DNA damage checkpoint protein 1-like, partial [Eriocheir sinensis]|uniref:mediator of DNA damage checkpoint protein 1-like n=1 Tax=Eriocheir sinensis TaxID=95602 RepID=UPI0021C8494C
MAYGESEYESAEENEEEMIQSPQEKTTMVSPNSPTSPLIWGNSSMLHAASAISTPNRSESFENSLLNSFEKMKIVEKDDDKFHDASDDVIIHQGNSCKELGPANIPTSPSKESVQPITSPCKESVQPITSPCKESVQPITSPCKESVQPTTSPSKESVQPITSPCKESVQPTTSPSKESVQPTTSPCKESVQPTTSPCKESVQPTTSPCKESVQPTTSPCKESVQPTTSPCKESVQPTTSPSKESVQPITSPSKESVQPTTSPSKESVQPTTSPSKESVQPITSPCKESVQPITSPCKESVQPITSPSKESVQPNTSPCKESVQPTTSPCKESVQPITSPCKESVQPTTSPSKESVQPITSPCKESVQPTTSPSKESVQPTTSPSKESVQPTTSPSKESVQPITSPSKETVQSACSQGKECTQAVCSPCKEDVQHNIPCVKDNSMPDKESKDFIPSKIEGLGPSSETVALSKCEIDTSLSCQVENMECSSDSIDLPHPTVTLPVGGAVESCTDHTELNRGAESFTLPVSQEELKCNSLPDQEKELHTFSSIIDTQVRDADTLQNTPKEQSETSQEMSCPQEEACAPASPHTKCSPSKKGYTDILDVLDDIDFNPFATKASVMNSPDRVDLPQTMNVDEREVQESVSQASRAKDEISDHQLSPAGSHNDNVKERVHSSIVQCDVDVDSTITMWTEEDAEKPRSYLSSPCESSDSKHLIKDKEPGQEQQAHKKQKPVAEKALTHPGKDCLPVSCKAYNLEYLEDPSYDPFTTKSCVVNTPERQGGISTTSNESTMSPESDEKTCKQLSRRMDEKVSESVKVNVSPEESVPQCPLKLEEADDSDEQVSLENTVVACPPELSEDSRETDSPSYKHFDLVGIVGDPNLDPFKTKASVANSPDRRTLHQSTGQESGQSTRKLNFGPQWQSQDVGQQLDHVSNIVSKEESKEKAKAHSGEPLPVPTPQDKLRDISAVSPSNRKGNRKSLAPEEEFFNASDFFSNPEVMDALETHGVQGNKCNLVRNSLYMKFDPLVSGRQSLAPYLAQQLLRIDQEDVRRSSGLISFSPSPKKKQKGEHHQEQEVPVESFFSTMDNIVTLDTTATTTLDSTALEATNETVIHNLTAAAMGKMVSEAEMNNRIKNVELMMQDEILRKSRIFEEEKKELTKKIEEQNIALLANEEEINSRKGTIQQMTNLVSRMKAAYDAAEKQHQENLEQQKAELEAKLSSSSEDHNQTQEELKKTEASFFQLVRKFERLREVCESLHQQKEKLVEELERVMQEKSQSAEKYKAALKTLQESHEK